MSHDQYQVIGQITIPEEKREEFIDKVMTVLDKGGIRKMQTVEVSGMPHTVVAPVSADEQNVLSFNYSIFEQRKRDDSTFDLNTLRLDTQDRGVAEYGLVMNAIMVLQVLYSTSFCYFASDGKPNPMGPYMRLLEDLLGEDVDYVQDPDMWGIIKLCHEHNITKRDMLDTVANILPSWWNNKDVSFFLTFWVCRTKEDFAPSQELKDVYYQDQRRLYWLLVRHLQDESLEGWLKKLLSLNYKGRSKLGETQDDYGEIARLTLGLHAQTVVYVYCVACGQDFWEVWELWGSDGYKDQVVHQRPIKEEEKRTLRFVTAIQREYMDEFLHLWDGDEEVLSEKMAAQLSLWKKAYEECVVPEDLKPEVLLCRILQEMDAWECRFVDGEFVDDFKEHLNNTAYQKLLLVLWDYLNEGADSFPELTGKQALDWILRENRDSYDRVLMSGFVSLMVNRKQRKRIFGV